MGNSDKLHTCSKRAHELNLLLREHVMIRRLKSDVMKELPRKTRSLIHLVIHPAKFRKTTEEKNDNFKVLPEGMSGSVLCALSQLEESKVVMEEDEEDEKEKDEGSKQEGEGREGCISTDLVEKQVETDDTDGRLGHAVVEEEEVVETSSSLRVEEIPAHIKTVYQQVALAKLSGACEWLGHLMSATVAEKVVVFAHHRRVMNALQHWAVRMNFCHVRIDGETSQRDRFERIRTFGDKAEMRLALVSVTAGGQGIDLTAASIAVFVELPPDVSWCRQAEDRYATLGR